VNIAGIILAAGASRRMGTSKTLLPWRYGTFLESVILAFEPPIDPLIVVIRAEEDIPSLKRLQMGKFARYVVNPDPERGQLSSLQCGLAAARKAQHFAFCPVDFPQVQRETVKELIRVYGNSDAQIVIPRFESRHGHPVIIGRAIADELIAEPPTGTARDVLHRHVAQTRYVTVDDPGVVADIDTPEEYKAAWQKFEGGG
jgi:molybdenum cofactor cytidylyltransferase